MSETGVLYDMKLRDLESVLKKKLGEQLSVIKYSTESLIPVGENYCSTMLKVHAVIKDEPHTEPRDLYLVAKMMPSTDYQRQIFDSEFTMWKESFFYQEVLPAYQQLEREFGVDADEIFDNAPIFYGSRFSKIGNGDVAADEKVDNDAVILMQNLKVPGYYTVDRFTGMDEEHARKSIPVMARFHALGMALKQHKPEFFETVKRHAKCQKFEIDDDEMAEIQLFLDMMRDDPVISPYFEEIKDAMSQDLHSVWEDAPAEPWSTIVHMDLWVNNLMFLKDPKTNSVVDVKFVDFQGYIFMSPLRDLVFFFMMNFNADLMENKFDELLDLYYDHFIKYLEVLKCDTKPFARDKFDAQLKIDAFLEFPHCPFMTKIMTTQLKQDELAIDKIENVLKSTEVSPLFMERLRMYVKKYAEKGWFSKK